MNVARDDDVLLLNRAKDAIDLSLKRNRPVFLGFLNEHESRLLKDAHFNCDVSFYGGYDGALRLMMGINAQKYEYPIALLKFTYRKEDVLTHRDFLGSLMGLGLTRDVIGDILVDDGRTYVFVKSEISEYILSQLKKVRRCGVNITRESDVELDYKQEYEVFDLTLSSLRLDVFVSALCNLSRERSSKLIRFENVSVNHYVVTSVSDALKEGDVITVRKYGKFVFERILGFSRKGKYIVEIKKYK